MCAQVNDDDAAVDDDDDAMMMVQSTEYLHNLDMKTLVNRSSCYNMFRMNRNVFDELHNLLVKSYGLKSTCRMS